MTSLIIWCTLAGYLAIGYMFSDFCDNAFSENSETMTPFQYHTVVMLWPFFLVLMVLYAKNK